MHTPYQPRTALLALAGATAMLLLSAPALARTPRAIGPEVGPEWKRGRTEIGVHVVGMGLNDPNDTSTGVALGGYGVDLRYRLSRRWGVNLGGDVAFGPEANGEVVRITAPLMASGLFYLFPNERFQLYGILGAGVGLNHVMYEKLGEDASFVTPMAQAGIGGQYRWSRMRLDMSVRGLVGERTEEHVRRGPMPEGSYELGDTDYLPYAGDRDIGGVMFTLGVTWGL
jgi:hypothetical protein